MVGTTPVSHSSQTLFCSKYLEVTVLHVGSVLEQAYFSSGILDLYCASCHKFLAT